MAAIRRIVLSTLVTASVQQGASTSAQTETVATIEIAPGATQRCPLSGHLRVLLSASLPRTGSSRGGAHLSVISGQRAATCWQASAERRSFMKLRPERPENQARIFEIQRAPLGGTVQARLVDALRSSAVSFLSLVAEVDEIRASLGQCPSMG